MVSRRMEPPDIESLPPPAPLDAAPTARAPLLDRKATRVANFAFFVHILCGAMLTCLAGGVALAAVHAPMLCRLTEDVANATKHAATNATTIATR